MKIMNDEDYHETREYISNIEGLLLELRRTHTPDEYDFVKAGWLRKVREAQAEIVDYLSETSPQGTAPADKVGV